MYTHCERENERKRGDYEGRREGRVGKERDEKGKREREKERDGDSWTAAAAAGRATSTEQTEQKRRGQRHRIAGRWASTHLPKTTSSPPSPPPMPMPPF